MQTFTEEQRLAILDKMGQAGVRLVCPRCGNNKSRLISGYAMLRIQMDLASGADTGSAIPTVVTVCERCGYLAQHALGVLGISLEAKK